MKTKSSLSYRAHSIYKMEDGIVCFKVKQDDIFDEPEVKNVLDFCEDANNGEPFLLLMDIGSFDLMMTKAARSLFNKYEKANRLIIAEAVVFDSVSNRILYNLLLKLNRPKFPFRAFNDVAKARAWLLQHD